MRSQTLFIYVKTSLGLIFCYTLWILISVVLLFCFPFWCSLIWVCRVKQWEFQMSVNSPGGTHSHTDLHKSSVILPPLLLVGADWIYQSREQPSQRQRLRKWTTRIEDIREPEAAGLLHIPGHFFGASHRGECLPELVACMLFCSIAHVHTDEWGAQTKTKFGKKVGELLKEIVKVLMRHRLHISLKCILAVYYSNLQFCSPPHPTPLECAFTIFRK